MGQRNKHCPGVRQIGALLAAPQDQSAVTYTGNAARLVRVGSDCLPMHFRGGCKDEMRSPAFLIPI